MTKLQNRLLAYQELRFFREPRAYLRARASCQSNRAEVLLSFVSAAALMPSAGITLTYNFLVCSVRTQGRGA